MKTQIIAEAGVNHNGNLEIAKELVIKASKAKVDYIKFQFFNHKNLITRNAPSAKYQQRNIKKKITQQDLLKDLELSEKQLFELYEFTKKHKIGFMLSFFGIENSNSIINKIKPKFIKIPSGEITNLPFLYNLSTKRVPLIMSTGMSNLEEINNAVATIFYGFKRQTDRDISLNNILNFYRKNYRPELLKNYLYLLHCTTEYPTPYKAINLNTIQTLKNQFHLKVGLSDHSVGIHVACAAVSLGAQIIEKHFTLDKNMEGPDHKASIDYDELSSMVRQIRDIEKSLGSKLKTLNKVEKENMKLVRKGIYAKKSISKGEKFNKNNICIKRPIGHLNPSFFWEIIGKKSKKKFEKDQPIEL